MSPTPLQSPRLAGLPGVRHGFFSRQGGVSSGFYAGLNVGIGSGDDPADVTENRRRAAAWFGEPPGALVTAYQIHSATALTTDNAAWPGERPQGDAIVTTKPGLICGALSADCAPVLIADAEAGVIAAVHAGWRGALDGVVASAVEAMVGLGAQPSRMAAAVGPCIGPACYEVGLEFLDAFIARTADNRRFFAPGASAAKRMFDLPAFVLEQLRLAGVTDAAWTGHDTCADEARFFSNRRAVLRGEADYGRLLSAIMLTRE